MFLDHKSLTERIMVVIIPLPKPSTGKGKFDGIGKFQVLSELHIIYNNLKGDRLKNKMP